MAQHNLKTVLSFEITRTLKKRSFWFLTLGFPLFLLIIIGISFLSNAGASQKAKELAKQEFSIRYIDESGIVQPAIASALKAQPITDKNQGIEEVRAGTIDAFFYIPKDPAKDPIETYGEELNLFNNSRYPDVASLMVTQSASASINQPELLALLDKNNLKTSNVTYKNGEKAPGFMSVVLPGLGLIIIYLVAVLLGNNLLQATLEEKENRVTEMILTTIKPVTLMLGKYFAVLVTGAIQLAASALPLILIYVWASSSGSGISLPFSMSDIVINPPQLLVAMALTLGAFVLISGSLLFIGAIMPTAKEAGNWLAPVFLALFAPIYLASTIVSDVSNIAVQILLWVPFTAPMTSLLANAVGNLPVAQGVLVALIMAATGALLFFASVRAFRYGSMSYTKIMSLKTIFLKR